MNVKLCHAGSTSETHSKIDEETNREILAAQNEWVLLAQFGTLSDELMFGDCGSIYYYIRKDDLAEKRFDKAWLVLQCG